MATTATKFACLFIPSYLLLLTSGTCNLMSHHISEVGPSVVTVNPKLGLDTSSDYLKPVEAAKLLYKTTPAITILMAME